MAPRKPTIVADQRRMRTVSRRINAAPTVAKMGVTKLMATTSVIGIIETA